MVIRARRKNKGYALVSIMVIAVFAILLMLAMGSMLISVMQSETVAKQKAGLLTACETGLEYVLHDIQRAVEVGEETYDFEDSSSPVFVNVPATWLDDSQVTVKARVRKLNSTDLLNSKSFALLWSPQLDPSESISTSFNDPVRSNLTEAQSKYIHTKIIEVTATKGIFATSIRAVSVPELNQPPQSSFPQVGILSIRDLTIAPDGDGLSIGAYGSNPTTQSSPSSYLLNLQSNQTINLASTSGGGTGDVKITANLIASNSTPGAPSDFVKSDGNVSIEGRVETNSGNPQNLTESENAPVPQPGDNVLANADIFDNPDAARTGENLDPINSDAGNQSIGANPVPSVDQVPVTTAGGNSTTNQLSSFLSTLGNYSDSGSTITLTHGIDSSGGEVSSYFTNSLVANDSVAKVVIDPANSSPTTIFIQGNNSTTAVDIDASRFINNGSPDNLQIYYDGPNNVNISMNGGDFNGLIYAPNAKVNIQNGSSPSSTQTFSGAIVGDSVNVSMGGKMSLMPDPSGGTGGGSSSIGNVSKYKVSTYQEVSGKLVE